MKGTGGFWEGGVGGCLFSRSAETEVQRESPTAADQETVDSRTKDTKGRQKNANNY